MFTFPKMSRSFLIVSLALLATSLASANFPWHKPIERDPAEVKRIMGPIGQLEPSRDLNIVWVWGIDKFHETDTHEHAWEMGRFAYDLLPNVPRLTITPSYKFPKKELWEKVDLVVFSLANYDEWDYDMVDAYQKRGGGLIFIHMAVLENTGVELAKRIGLAWSHRGPGNDNRETPWGPLPSPVSLTAAAANHPIFKRFPPKIEFNEEFYWHLLGDPASVTPLMTTPAGPAIANKVPALPPKLEDLDGKAWPVMWATEVGKGRVFVSLPGHNFYTFNDPYFRIILLRAIAWTMNESFDPFKPLVTLHLQRQ